MEGVEVSLSKAVDCDGVRNAGGERQPGGAEWRVAGRTLREMGYTKVFNGGGFKDLAGAGIAVEK